MRGSVENQHWTRHLFYRAEHTRTTWRFRFGLLATLVFVGWLTRGWLSVVIADSLVCNGSAAPSDAILVENFDPTYLTFETAARLRKAGVASRVLVPVARNQNDAEVNRVSRGVAELMADIARLGPIEVIPIGEVEPVSLNAAREILQFVEGQRIRSVVVVTPLFRSRRSQLVYEATLGAAGVAVTCEPVRGGRDRDTWSQSWHGVQNVLEQWIKLQYYRLYVLPFQVSHGTNE